MSDFEKSVIAQEEVRLSKNGTPIPKQLIPYQTGQSGNPSGRPKQTKEQKEMMDEIRKLGPRCIKAMTDILDGRSALARVRMIEIILGYIIGKPESNIHLEISTEERVMQSELRIAALIQTIEQGGMVTDGEYGNLASPSETVEIPASDRERDRIPGLDEASQRLDS